MIAKANKPFLRALDGGDGAGVTVGGGGIGGGGDGGGGGGIGIEIPQGLHILPEPEQRIWEPGYIPHSLQLDTHGPGRIFGNGRLKPEVEPLGQPGPQQITEKLLLVNPQVKFNPATIDSKKNPSVKLLENSPFPPQQMTELFNLLVAQT